MGGGVSLFNHLSISGGREREGGEGGEKLTVARSDERKKTGKGKQKRPNPFFLFA